MTGIGLGLGRKYCASGGNMSIEVIGIVAVLIGLVALYCDQSFIIYVFVCSTLLGSAAALVLDSFGGASIPPASLLLVFVVFRLMRDPSVFRGSLQAIGFGRPGFWLVVTVTISVASAFLLPRLFAGEVFVFPARPQSPYPELLWPANSNLTQSVYFVGDLVCFVLVSGFASRGSGTRVLLNAALIAAILNLTFAALDVLTYSTNTAELLSFIRNAKYVIFTDDQVAGFKRIIGSFPEASTFGGNTLGYFALALRLWLLRIYPRLTFTVMLLSLLAMLLATSTTAYVGLGIYLAFLYCEILFRSLSRPLTPQMQVFIWGTPLLLMIIILFVAVTDAGWAYFKGLADLFVFDKLNSASGEERSAFNRLAIQNFFDTYGFGVGNGSVRASSFLVAVIANLGILGAVPFAIFMMNMFLGGGKEDTLDPLSYPIRAAAKSMCLAWLIAASISSSQVDLGLVFYTFAALACANRSPVFVERRDFNTWTPDDARTQFR